MKKDKSASSITVRDTKIRIVTLDGTDYISLTDMLKAKDGDFFVSDWLRNRNTLEFLSVWETMYNPDFSKSAFDEIKSRAGLNNFKIDPDEWTSLTKAAGLRRVNGRYGGIYAHRDIAFEFGMWISPEFKIYLIKEYQRSRESGSRNRSAWDVTRELGKTNYRLHASAIKENLIPKEITPDEAVLIYAGEADLLNVALFGVTADKWKETHPELSGNIRDNATLEQLVVLMNLESVNAVLIEKKMSPQERLIELNKVARSQLEALSARSSKLPADKTGREE